MTTMEQETTHDPVLIEAIEDALPWQLHEAGEATKTAHKVLAVLGPHLAENARLRAQVQRIRDLADRMEAESPKPGPGGFIAETLRDELDKES